MLLIKVFLGPLKEGVKVYWYNLQVKFWDIVKNPSPKVTFLGGGVSHVQINALRLLKTCENL